LTGVFMTAWRSVCDRAGFAGAFGQGLCGVAGGELGGVAGGELGGVPGGELGGVPGSASGMPVVPGRLLASSC
jgi:hypothetical protein